MGKRKLAYEINFISEGYYVLVKFTSGPISRLSWIVCWASRTVFSAP